MKPGLTIALPKGRLFRASVTLLEKIHCSAAGLGQGRRLVFEDAEQRTRFLILRPVTFLPMSSTVLRMWGLLAKM